MNSLASEEKEALLTRLELMQIEPPGAEKTFAARLALENRWTPEFAGRVLSEYRRFLFLAATAGHPVTPSDEVDQAWHLHLAYSLHYWDELCGGILGNPLHHGPTRGGKTETTRFRDQYAATLASYRAAFGTAPPADIWPPQSERFGARFERVDRSRNWVIPKIPWSIRLFLLAFIGLAFLNYTSGKSPTGGLVAASFLGLVTIGVVYDTHRRARGGDERSASNPAHTAGGCGGCGAGATGATHNWDDGAGGDGGCGSGCGGGCGGCGG